MSVNVDLGAAVLRRAVMGPDEVSDVAIDALVDLQMAETEAEAADVLRGALDAYRRLTGIYRAEGLHDYEGAIASRIALKLEEALG